MTAVLAYRPLERRIVSREDLDKFLESSTCAGLLGFILDCNASVQGRTTRSEVETSNTVVQLLAILDKVMEIAKATPPTTAENEKSRFGNPAFRLFYDKVAQALPTLLQDFVQPQESIVELAKYLEKSFGDRKRIDYGTGHELNFIAFLYCLKLLGLVHDVDYSALVLRVFVSYLAVMRHLQFAYWLEPAGSHGVWGLDDYHSLPFMFGSSQLIEHKYIRPKSIHDRDVVETYAQDYMYLACIQFINSVKTTTSLRWHSPMLDDISGVRTWAKTNQGMIKMYRAEVLSKLPIMQHFMFGALIPYDDNVSGKSVPVDSEDMVSALDGHAHVYAMGQEFPTCCGMRLPSAIAARQLEGKDKKDLPFD
ncbi:Serine/threonine-protein phosphatase 2A activator 2 [Sorochytrium milnesiophthora]